VLQGAQGAQGGPVLLGGQEAPGKVFARNDRASEMSLGTHSRDWEDLTKIFLHCRDPQDQEVPLRSTEAQTQ
jgi:hypothetical protein